MFGCRTAQFLVAKEGDDMAALNLTWEPEADDMAFETETEYFLSGLCDDLPLYQFDTDVSLARRGVWTVRSPGDPQLNFNKNETSLVFHSWCWGAWMQICKLELGENEGADDEDDCDDELGSDYGYTVTNPFFVHRLQGLIDKVANANSITDISPAPSEAPPAPQRTTENDPFTALPREVRSMILAHLPQSDPQSTRCLIILRTPPQLALETHTTRRHALMSQRDIEKYRKEDSVPGHTINVQARISNLPWAWKVPPHNTTNWHMLYGEIKRETEGIRGLRNQRRIWKHLEEVVKGVRGDWDERTVEGDRGHPLFGA
ncbi:hypothetical protein BDW75DRAFT_235904 [Aspergillus navahoensis]